MIYGKLNRKDLYLFLDNKENKATAKEVFGDHQPSIIKTGWYSAPSWNWSYSYGITQQEGKTYFVVTGFGQVEAAREFDLSRYDISLKN
jgi:hypothetical protein